MAGDHVANDIEDTKESLADDKKFLQDLEKNCDTKKAQYEENMKMRGQELVALADTIKVNGGIEGGVVKFLDALLSVAPPSALCVSRSVWFSILSLFGARNTLFLEAFTLQ